MSLGNVTDAQQLFMIIFLDCSNNFVRVGADSSSYTITCVFLTPSADTKKSCNVTYGLCQHKKTQNVGTSDPTDSDTITVQLELESSMLNQTLCYVVKASAGVVTIEVEGRFGECCVTS